MQYAFDIGASEQTIIRQALQAGQPIPSRIANAPNLIQGLEIYLQAFFDLDSERSHAMGPTSIPWTSISEYAKAFEFDETQTEDLFFFIKKLDGENLKRIEKKQNAKNTK